MKPSLECAYLLEDRTLVEVYQETHPRAGQVEYAVVTEGYALNAPKGRLVLYWGALGLLPLMKGAKIGATEGDVNKGSDNTKARGIAVGSLTIQAAGSTHILHLNTFPDLISTGWTYQPDARPITFGEIVDAGAWTDYRVAKVHRAKNGNGKAA